MSLTALAVVSRQGTPIYMCDYADSADLLFDPYGDIDDNDVFDDPEMTRTQKNEWPCRLKYQFVLHSACERFEEVLRGPMNRWKAPGSVGMDANWVGLLCLSDNLRAYGYVTTNTRYVTLVEDSIAPENVQLQKSRDNEICVVMANVHRLYTETLLNPFTPLHSKITSKRFERGVTTLVHGSNGN